MILNDSNVDYISSNSVQYQADSSGVAWCVASTGQGEKSTPSPQKFRQKTGKVEKIELMIQGTGKNQAKIRKKEKMGRKRQKDNTKIMKVLSPCPADG